MKHIFKLLSRFRNRVLHSIAFYPVLISLLFVLLAFGLLVLERLVIVEELAKRLPFLIVKEYDTARTILSTIFGGILSLTVFTFTMVMVVLNQASSNYSPRLLPGLISSRKHQVILGTYVGTLLMALILLMVMGSYGPETNQIGFPVMVTAFCGILCMALFVYFIHNISDSIQIHNIINTIYNTSNRLLDKTLELQKETGPYYNAVKTEGWQLIRSDKTGYYRSFNQSLLVSQLLKTDNCIEVLPYPDQHIWEGAPLLRVQRPVDEKTTKNLQLCCYILSNQHEDDSATGGMIKLSEIAVRALSPGVNDPGTALNALSKIGQLLEKSLRIQIVLRLSSKKEVQVAVLQNHITAAELMRVVVEPIRQYGKADSAVAQRLLAALLFVSHSSRVLPQHLPAVRAEIEALRADIAAHLDNERDKERLLSIQRPDELPTNR